MKTKPLITKSITRTNNDHKNHFSFYYWIYFFSLWIFSVLSKKISKIDEYEKEKNKNCTV